MKITKEKMKSRNTSETTVCKQKHSTKQSWITDEIIQLMEKRRTLKAINNYQYKVTQQEKDGSAELQKKLITLTNAKK